MKQYNGEKAIISLTSWKARINTVSKTLYSLIHQCPGFHIVLVLSEEEFPKKEKELPENLMLFVENNLIEILWVYKNYKSFKKILFTMEKYRNIPVISADDDCLYKYNYAEELFKRWETNKNKAVTQSASFGSGFGVLMTYDMIKNYEQFLNNQVIATNHDDLFYRFLLIKNGIKCSFLHYRNELVGKEVEFNSTDGISSGINELKNIEIFNKVFNTKLTQKHIGDYVFVK